MEISRKTVFLLIFWCSFCDLWLCFLVLHLCSLIGLAGAPFWQNLWSLWCSICGLWLCFLVLHLCSLIGLSGAPFWQNLWSLWCSVCGLWLYFLVLRLCSLIGLAGAPFWQNLWSLWCSVCGLWLCFFCKAHTATRTAKIGQLYRGQAVSQRCFLAPFLVLRLVLSGASAGAPFVASPCAFFWFLLCIVASINIKLCPIYWHEFRV